MQATHLKAFIICATLCPILALAQEKQPSPVPTHYKLVYRLLQLGADGKGSSSHSYSAIVVADDPNAGVSKIRNGDKVPIVTGTSTGASESSLVNTQYQYQDVGTDIDSIHPTMRNDQLSLRVSASASTVVKSPSDAHPVAPVFRDVRWESNVVVTLDKPTIIFTSDNVSDTGKTELELTATQIKEPN